MRVGKCLLIVVGAMGLGAIPACARSVRYGPLADVIERDLGPLADQDRSMLGGGGSSIRARASDEVFGAGDGQDVEVYVRLALERNPSIRSAAQRIERLAERVPQVTTLDDPTLSLTPIGEMAETAAGQVQVTSSISQRFPAFGKLAARGRVAQQDVAMARQDLEQVRLSVAADTRRAYWGLYYAARAIEVTKASGELLSRLVEVTQAKYRAGTATQEAVLRASVERANLQNELLGFEQRRTTAVAMLNWMIDRAIDAPIADPAPRELAPVEVRLDMLLKQAQQSNPAIGRLREQIRRFREQRELARLNRHPDVTVGFSYNLVDSDGLSGVANGDDQWFVGFTVNLPIWERRLAAAEREATRGILESAGALAGEQNRVAFRVQDALVRVQTQQRQARLLRDAIVPDARQTVEASLSGYRSGKVDFLTLIENWRKLLDFELMHQSMLSELERSFAELQEAVGRDLARAPGGTDAQGAGNDQPDSTMEDKR